MHIQAGLTEVLALAGTEAQLSGSPRGARLKYLAFL